MKRTKMILSGVKYAHRGNLVASFSDTAKSEDGDWKIISSVERRSDGSFMASDLFYTPCGKIIDLHRLLEQNGYGHIRAKPMP